MKVFFDTIGCRLNQSEIERMAALARLNGHEVVAQASQADIVIVNTCAVTLAASSDSRMKIRQAARAGARVVATGCYATVAPEVVSSLPGVVDVHPNEKKDEIITDILGEKSNSEIHPGSVRIPLPGKQHRTRAFIKVQDGCDNFCTFCITRIARGRSISQPQDEIYRDIESALGGGVKEIVLTGVNLGAWGRETGMVSTLAGLIKQILIDLKPPRLRLSSLEPWDFQQGFFEVIGMPGFCRHLHLPLQSGSRSVLKRMGRRNTTQDFRKLVEGLRAAVPDIAITTDILVGFPGETEEEFTESLDFVEELRLAGGHVFSFSPRQGTPAEKLAGRLPSAIAKTRSERMRRLIASSRRDYQARFLGCELQVLWERSEKSSGEWILEGLTDTYLRVQASHPSDLYNQFSNVRIIEADGEVMQGKII